MKIIKNTVIELDQAEIKQAIINYIENRTDYGPVPPADVTLQVSGNLTVTASVVLE